MTNAIKALIKAQTEMGKALKDSTNPHFRSKYASLASAIDATKPALNENGFAVIQMDGIDDDGRYVETVFAHESGEQFATRIHLIIGKNDMQGYGSAQTYARRYGLLELAGIAPEDDDGNKASETPIGPSDSAVAKTIKEIEATETLDDLANYWKNLAANVGLLARHEKVVAAKDAQKIKLALDGDEIPH